MAAAIRFAAVKLAGNRRLRVCKWQADDSEITLKSQNDLPSIALALMYSKELARTTVH